MALKLFREEVLESQTKRAFGNVLLTHPVSHYALAALGLVVLSVLLLFAILGRYTRHESVTGVLEPSNGVIKLYATQSGELKICNVRVGQSVRKGEVLLVFASEHKGSDGQTIETELDLKSDDRLSQMRAELGSTLKIQRNDAENLRESLAAQQSSRESLRTQLHTLTSRVHSAEQALARYEHLQQAGFMPDIQVQQKRDELLDQQLRLQDLQKTAATIETDIRHLQRDIESIPERTNVIQAQMARNISSAEAELSKQRNDHEWSVVAPCNGVIASLTIAHNQTAGVGIPLVTVVPSNSNLQATLYSPSRSLGFVRIGQEVNLKVDAFPFQKFGFVTGKVSQIADSPVAANEISTGTRLAASAADGEPMYTIAVELDRQFVDAYGHAQRLRPGMQLDADIKLDTRALYEWALEPLYSMRRD